MKRSFGLLALAVLAVPAVASAQVVYIAPPPPPLPPIPPPVYVSPGVVPPHVYIRERIRWHLRRVPRVVVVTNPAPVYAPPPTVCVAPAPSCTTAGTTSASAVSFSFAPRRTSSPSSPPSTTARPRPASIASTS